MYDEGKRFLRNTGIACLHLNCLQVYDEGKRIVDEVESMGGMAAAVASGWPKLKVNNWWADY